MNNAVIGGAAVPPSAATGNINTTVPNATATANPATTAAAGRRKTASTGDRRPGIALATPGRIGPARHRRDRATTIHGTRQLVVRTGWPGAPAPDASRTTLRLEPSRRPPSRRPAVHVPARPNRQDLGRAGRPAAA